ncbi:MAG: SDR family NAD(P)-dependent oxidoreductase [Burkholderiales bacterium]
MPMRPEADRPPLPKRPALPGLKGKVVLIMGGARGLGAAIGRVLGEEGATIVLADVMVARLKLYTAVLMEQGIAAESVVVDVGNHLQVATALREVHLRHGRLDGVINRSVTDVGVPLHALSVDDWERVVRTDLSGAFVVAKQAAALMLKDIAQAADGRLCHIVNILSSAAKQAGPGAVACHATQWGLLGMSHALHAELRPHGVMVSAVVAGAPQDPMSVAHAVRFVLTQPVGTVVPELSVMPLAEST